MSKTHCIQKINFWVEILGENIIGTLSYRENWAGDAYLEALHGTIYPLITQVIVNLVEVLGEQVISEDNVIYQYDSCLAHFKNKHEWLLNSKLS